MSNRLATDTFKECSNTNAQGVCMYRGPCLECAVNQARAAELKAGDLVYRVIEIDQPDDDYDNPKPHSWKVASVALKSVSDKQITFKTYLPGLRGVRWPPTALGRLFFTTPEEAIEYFAEIQRELINSYSRKQLEARRAIAWAEVNARKEHFVQIVKTLKGAR